MPLSLMLWALFVVPLWMLLVAPLAHPDRPPLLFAGAVVALTAAAWIADRRFGAPGPVRYFWPARRRWLGFAALAGMGVTILASDVGNVASHLVQASTELREPPADPDGLAIKIAFFHAGLLLVTVAVAQRTLLALHRPWIAIGLAVLISVMPTPTPIHLWPQWILVVGLPAWLFRHTRSVALALVAYTPTIVLPLLRLTGVEIGIRGFDVLEPGSYVFQPVWFNVLGAALVAAGIGPLLRDFDAIQRLIDDDGSDDPPDDSAR